MLSTRLTKVLRLFFTYLCGEAQAANRPGYVMNATSSMSPTDRLAEAEAEKVNLEIEQLRRPPYRRVSFWTGIVIPLVALTASIITGELTGFFDDQLASLEQQKLDLKQQLENVRGTAEVLSANNNRLKEENVVLTQGKDRLEEEKTSLQTQLSKLDSTIVVQQDKVKKLEAEARQLGTDAQAAARGLGTVFNDLDQLLGEKGQLYILVRETPMDESAKQELLNRLGQHLGSIQATGTHLSEVRKVLRRMKAVSG